jgi:putative ATP-binding cassette transporter
VLKISAAVTFLSVPVFGLMQSLAIMRATEEAARRMIALEGELVALAEAESSAGQSLPRDFGQLEMRGIAYAFPARQGERGFTIGPLNIRLKRGEVVFVTGGNGAGKSTFLKLLTHLYSPRQGEILVDGQTVDLARLAAYRDLIAPVFSDFHLFERLYGLGQDAWRAAEPLLDMMEMTRHVRVEQGRFSKLDLSTGQRKRLALVAALLENRPVLVLDEWAADQDPHFRRKFYRELIPWLRRDGKTIVAVTHDDHYFDAADRLWHLEEGQLTELPPPGKDA